MLSDPWSYPSLLVLICLGLFPKLRFWETVNNLKFFQQIGFLVSDVIEANRIEPIRSKIPHIEDAPRPFLALSLRHQIKRPVTVTTVMRIPISVTRTR